MIRRNLATVIDLASERRRRRMYCGDQELALADVADADPASAEIMLRDYERAERWRQRRIEGSVVLIVTALLASVLWLAGGL